MIWQYILGFIALMAVMIVGIVIGSKGTQEEKLHYSSRELAVNSLELIYRYRVLILIYRTANPFDNSTRYRWSRAYNDLMILWLRIEKELSQRGKLDLVKLSDPLEFTKEISITHLDLENIFDRDRHFAKTIDKLLYELRNYHEDLYEIQRLVQKVKDENEILIDYQRYLRDLDSELNWSSINKAISDILLPSISDLRFNRLHGDSTTDAPPPKKKRKNK